MPTDDELYWLIALTTAPGIGAIRANALLRHFGTAELAFEACDGKGLENPAAIHRTLAFIRRFNIQAWCMSDPRYPWRLAECYDPPALLYFKGNADLNAHHVLSVVGTRLPSAYGKQITKEIIRDLVPYDVVIVSGLADGIDGFAHRCALDNGLATVGVLGHGLDTVYPSGNRLLAASMLENGGLLTEFKEGVGPEASHFPMRNRIVAGIPEATVIVETGVKGGSMVTAALARGYHREVFAIPGRITDAKSSGCLALIHNNAAALITSAEDIARLLLWKPVSALTPRHNVPLVTREDSQTLLLEFLRDREAVHFDELQRQSGLSANAIATALLALELDQAIDVLPGKLYRLGS